MAAIDGEPDQPAGRSRRFAVWAIAIAVALLMGGVAFAVSASNHHSRNVATPLTVPTQPDLGSTATPSNPTGSTTKTTKPTRTTKTTPKTRPSSTSSRPTGASHVTTPPVVIPPRTTPHGTTSHVTSPPVTSPPHPRPTTTTISPTSPFAKIAGPSPACIGSKSYSYTAVDVRNGAYGYWTYLNAGVPAIKTWHAGQPLSVVFRGPAGTRLSIDLSLSNAAGVTRDFHKKVTMINC